VIRGKHELLFGFHFRYDQMNLLPHSSRGGSDVGTQQHLLYDPTTPAQQSPGGSFHRDQFANFYLGLGNYNNSVDRGLSLASKSTRLFPGQLARDVRLNLNLGPALPICSPYYEKNNAVASFHPASMR